MLTALLGRNARDRSHPWPLNISLRGFSEKEAGGIFMVIGMKYAMSDILRLVLYGSFLNAQSYRLPDSILLEGNVNHAEAVPACREVNGQLRAVNGSIAPVGHRKRLGEASTSLPALTAVFTF